MVCSLKQTQQIPRIANLEPCFLLSQTGLDRRLRACVFGAVPRVRGSPEELLAEGVFLLGGDLSGRKSRSPQRLRQPPGQQRRAVPVQSQQHLRQVLRQAVGGAASQRLEGEMRDISVTSPCTGGRDWLGSESPPGRSPSGASRQPAAPGRAEARPSSAETAPPAHGEYFKRTDG